MIWSADLILLLAVGAEVPAVVAARVQATVADRWDVAPANVVLEWGRVPDSLVVSDAVVFRLLGSGRDGRFVVAFRTAERETAVTLHAGFRDSIWVAAEPMAMGRRLEHADLRRSERTHWGPPPLDLAGAPVGWEVRRNLAAGDPLLPPSVAEPPLIEPGDEVTFQWQRGGLTVVRTGIAVSRARRGERVMARDPLRGDQLFGTATGPRRARMEGKKAR